MSEQMAHPRSTILRYFEYTHLPAHLQPISSAIYDVAMKMENTLLPSPEKTAGLRKLLEAKDCFVHAALDNAQ